MHPLLQSIQAAALDPYESITQALRDNAERDLGDPQTPGTPAFHLRHTVEVFRYHARKAIAAIDPSRVDDIPSDEHVPIPRTGDWSPQAALDDLADSIRVFNAFMRDQPDAVYTRTIEHGRTFTIAEFLTMMASHIVWHAAAIHYRATPPPDAT